MILLSACLGLLLLSAVFYVVPFTRSVDRPADSTEANVDWYRQREQELASESQALSEDAKLRLLEDTEAVEPAIAGASGRFHSWLLLPVVIAMSGFLYQQLGAAPDVAITRDLQGLNEDSSPQKMSALIAAMESRLAQRPDNLHYSALLGRYYMRQQDYAKASTVYRDLATAAPEDAQALAFAAQADFMAKGRVLSDDSRLLAEQSLAIDPGQRTALGLLGMASFEQEQYRAAIAYWERLMAAEPAGSEGAQMIASVIEQARMRLSGDPGQINDDPVAPGAASNAPPAVSSAGVTVRVSLPQSADVNPGATVFVLARAAGSDSRMPIAVQRITAAQLPAVLRLEDGNSMAGQLLSEAGEVMVFAQLSPGGQPGEANATWLGQVGPVAPDESNEILALELTPRS